MNLVKRKDIFLIVSGTPMLGNDYFHGFFRSLFVILPKNRFFSTKGNPMNE